MKKTRWRKAEKQLSDPTATTAGNALTQLQFRLRLRLLASPKSRPAAETLGTRSTPRPPPPSPTPQSPGLENALSAPRGPTSGLLGWFRSPARGPREPHFRPFTARSPCKAPSTALPFRGTRNGHQPVRTLTRRAWVSRVCCWVTGLLRPRPGLSCFGLSLLPEPPEPQPTGRAAPLAAQPRLKKWEFLRGVPEAAAFSGEAAVSSRKPEARGDPWRPGLFSVRFQTLGNRNSAALGAALRSLSSG